MTRMISDMLCKMIIKIFKTIPVKHQGYGNRNMNQALAINSAIFIVDL